MPGEKGELKLANKRWWEQESVNIYGKLLEQKSENEVQKLHIQTDSIEMPLNEFGVCLCAFSTGNKLDWVCTMRAKSIQCTQYLLHVYDNAN